MWPVLARFGPYTLYTYTVLLSLAVAVALARLYRAAPPDQRNRWLDAGIAATLGGLLGARLAYVLANGAYYAARPIEALMFWQGGLGWPGAAAGGLLGLWLYARRAREPLPPLLDALALPVGLLSLLSWGGCLASGCAYGAEVTPGQLPAWLVSTAPDLYGLSTPRWPVQAVGIAWSLFALAAMWANRRARWPAGAQGLYALSLAALGPFLLGFVRGDPMPLLAAIRLDVVASGLVLVAATLAWAALVLRRPASASTPAP